MITYTFPLAHAKYLPSGLHIANLHVLLDSLKPLSTMSKCNPSNILTPNVPLPIEIGYELIFTVVFVLHI